MALHSQALNQLDEAQRELTDRANTEIKANRTALYNMEKTYSNLVTPLLEVTGIASGSSQQDGPGEKFDMTAILPQFETKIDNANNELETLWAT